MKYLIRIVFVVLLVTSLSILAFNPNELNSAKVVGIAPCFGYTCAIFNKDGVDYLVVGELDGDKFIPIDIFIIEDGKPKKIWNILWKEV